MELSLLLYVKTHKTKTYAYANNITTTTTSSFWVNVLRHFPMPTRLPHTAAGSLTSVACQASTDERLLQPAVFPLDSRRCLRHAHLVADVIGTARPAPDRSDAFNSRSASRRGNENAQYSGYRLSPHSCHYRI